MNKFSFFAIALLSLMIAGCGGKKGGGGSGAGSFSNALSTQEGLLDRNGNFTVGSFTYTIDRNSFMAIDQAIAVARQRNIQPQMMMGGQSRARLSATVYGQQMGYPAQPGYPTQPGYPAYPQPYPAYPTQPGYPAYPQNPGMGPQTISVQSAEILN